MSDTPRVYVVCIESDGEHGAWVDAVDADDLEEGIQDMIEASPAEDAEEWEIQGSENFYDLTLETASLALIADLGRLVEEYGEPYAAFADNEGIEHADENRFNECYQGEWSSETAFAEHIFDECIEVPAAAAGYIDYDSYANDLFMGDYYSIVTSGGVYVYQNM